MPVKAVAITESTPKPCTGFTLEVKVVPKKDLKLHVVVDKTCVNNQPRWGLIFELDKNDVQIVFVSYQPKLDDTQAQGGIQKMLADKKITKEQQAVAKNEILPATAAIEGVENPTPAQKAAIEQASRKMTVLHIGG
ncbi:MAG: hypothetical protein ABI999_09365 [Acidobacteriota bacterium]